MHTRPSLALSEWTVLVCRLRTLQPPPLISLFCSPLPPYENLCIHWDVEMGFETWVPHVPGCQHLKINYFPLHQYLPLDYWLSLQQAVRPAFSYNGIFVEIRRRYTTLTQAEGLTASSQMEFWTADVLCLSSGFALPVLQHCQKKEMTT